MNMIDHFRQTVRSERGGALILVLIGAIILSITGISMLRQSQTDYSISTHHYFDKTALFAADAGLNEGIRQLHDTPYPPSIIINESEPVSYDSQTYHFRSLLSGTLSETEAGAQNVKGMDNLVPPMPAGQSISSGMVPAGWDLTISSRIYLSQDEMDNDKNLKARKEIQTMLVTIATLGH